MGAQRKKDRHTLPERVAQLYYSHALFCSSHPVLVICLALTCFLSCCYPLLNIPLPGSTPTRITLPCVPCSPNTPQSQNNAGTESSVSDSTKQVGGILCSTLCINNMSDDQVNTNTASTPGVGQPLLYVHQLVLNTGVWPWSELLRAEDAYRTPLQEVFRLLDIIRNHQDPVTGTSLGHVCYHVESVSGSKRTYYDEPPGRMHTSSGVLPEYNCLVLSPANLWHQDLDKFSLDPDPLETIFSHQSLQKGKISTAEMVFGMHLKETGIKRYPLVARTRTVQYAVTLFYSQLNVRYMRSLNEKLLTAYPESKVEDVQTTFIYYPADFNYYEFVPLCVAFVGLFVYIYFSVRKIEFIKSKVGLATSAVVSIAAGLTMSIGICFFFGLTLSFRGKEIFPYLVILVGLENVFVLTKSVMSIDSQLDVKIRLAQGLSKEGWSITKNILTEITILTLCLFTFIPVIQQFSIFMIVSLLSDFFLQMLFFTTVLGIDIRRKELSRSRPSTFQFYGLGKFGQQDLTKFHNKSNEIASDRGRERALPRSKSQPRLSDSCPCPCSPQTLSPGLTLRSRAEEHRSKIDPNQSPQDRVPKRIRLVNVWARTRFFQRAFMVWMVVWVSMIIYSSGVVEDLLIVHHHNHNSTMERPWKIEDGPSSVASVQKSQACNSSTECTGEVWSIRSGTSPPARHWAALLAHYNVSCAGRHLVIAPPLHLHHRVSPEVAVAARPPPPLHPSPPLRWRAFAAALEPLDFSDTDKEEGRWMWKRPAGEEQPFYPTSLMELLLLAMLCVISVLVISYMMLVLYRCVCTRNYAEWRATWTKCDGDATTGTKHHKPQVVLEAVPVVVEGHNHDVECLAVASDMHGDTLVSCCLQGTIKVWDSTTGKLITTINRAKFFSLQNDVLNKEDKPNTNDDLQQQCSSTVSGETILSHQHFQLKKGKDDGGSGSPLFSNFKFSSNPPSYHALSSITNKYRTMYDFTLHYSNLIERGKVMPISSEVGDNNTAFDKLSDVDNADSEYSNSRKSSEASDGSEHYTAIWCMEVCKTWNVIVVGCADGRLECWDAFAGSLVCIVESDRGGITHIQVVRDLIILCRLSGDLEIFLLTPPPSSRGHIRTGSAGSISMMSTSPTHLYNRFGLNSNRSNTNEGQGTRGSIECKMVSDVRAHQQPVLALECDFRRVITGSLDHTVKVFWMDTLTPAFTLHGHRGPIRSLFLDSLATVCASGSSEGLLCVWDMVTGACVYSVTAHDGAVTALSVTASYVMSLGGDDRLCIWDRFRGHLLNAVSLGEGTGGCGLLSLGPSLVVSGGRGGLILWDASTATALRKVHFGPNEECGCNMFARQILPLRDGIVCDYFNQLRIVRFPKND